MATDSGGGGGEQDGGCCEQHGGGEHDGHCGSSNPTQLADSTRARPVKSAAATSWAVMATPAGRRWSCEDGDVRFDDEVWEVRLHFHDRDNLERTMSVSDITYLNLVALAESAGYSSRDYFYFVRQAALGIAGLDEICDDEKVDEMLDHIANEEKKVVNLTVIRATDPKPVDLNSGHLCEDQPAMSEVGEKIVYEVDNAGVLFRSPQKSSKVG